MREVTREMIRAYQLMKLGYDFMGYEFDRQEDLSFHHLIIPKKDCLHMERKGYEEWNGAILVQDTAHEYLHRIQCYDDDLFMAISVLMIEENLNGKVDMEHIKKIHDILTCFEREYLGRTTNSGKEIIKDDYVMKRTLLRRY